MDKNEIFEYVMNTPDNTNPAILRGMLDMLDSNENQTFIVDLYAPNGGSGDYSDAICNRTNAEMQEAFYSGKNIILFLHENLEQPDEVTIGMYISLYKAVQTINWDDFSKPMIREFWFLVDSDWLEDGEWGYICLEPGSLDSTMSAKSMNLIYY